ncbi:hypothetical protein BDZ90DRAFT_7243 [Jaminaea rosea]|uniref:GPI transamidase component PIG-S n=1 Tax=Jaminaea rosea TaxID=1569628 RepID=A0A316UY41_9BASI|nr:hypothetical protein BDZ90DRAFT_7243 [Jaminaea rosea]PWN30220.1 hypothetical protein BDZ90DRAFT_7243 [Jaminaea rosea]
MAPAMGSSSQSTSTRVAILVSLYALILVCFPYARSLVSVHRRPIDETAIAQWQKKQQTTCPIALPALIGIKGIEAEMRDDGWGQKVKERAAALLQQATDAPSSHEESWCLKWDITTDNMRAEQADFVYDVHPSAWLHGSTIHHLALPSNTSSYSPDSVAIALARRIALDLNLPLKHLLVNTEAGAPTGTEGSSSEAAAVDPVPEPEAPPFSPQRPPRPPLPALSLADDEEVLRRLEYDQTSAGKVDAHSDISIPLPPRLLLSLHVLNEDLPSIPQSSNTSHPPQLLAPLASSPSFIKDLQSELHDVARSLQGVTRIGFETHWGLDAKTNGVKWEEVEWMTEEKWVEWEEREFEETVDEEYDDPDEDKARAGNDGQEEEASAAPSPRKRVRSVTRTRKERVPIDKSRPVTKSVHVLSPDQLEIFVDEGAWGLTETSVSPATPPTGTEKRRNRFPDLFPRQDSSADEAENQEETKTLHLVLYKPSREHTPLIHLAATALDEAGTEADGDVDVSLQKEQQQQQTKIAAAVAQEAEPVHWGWTVPGWGGVVIYNEGQGESGREGAGLHLLSPSEQDQRDILDLWGRQIRSLLGLPAVQEEQHGASQRRAHFHLLRLTLLKRIRSSLESLIALHQVLARLPSLEVGRAVQERVELALKALQELDGATSPASSSSNSLSPPRSLRSCFSLSSLAERHAGEAFHHHRMVGLLYFPAEHTWAVYTPLFGPLIVPLVLAGAREMKLWAQRRKRRRRATAGKVR